MTPDQTVIHVTEYDFEYEVLSYSQNKPVIVEYWAPWSQNALRLSPILERLIYEYQGALRLAKVNVDESPNLAIQFGVRSVPTVKAYTSGEVVGEFVDFQPEERIRAFLRQLNPPSTVNLALERADSLAAAHQWQSAAQEYLNILEESPGQPKAALGYLRCCLAQDDAAGALAAIRSFPPSRQYNQAMQLQPLAAAMSQQAAGLLPQESDADMAFNRCVLLVRKGNFLAAMDGLIDLLRADKHYRNGLARQVMLALLDIWGEDAPETRQYRGELATILF